MQEGDKLVAYCWRGIDINAALQRCQSAMFVGNNVDFRLIYALAVVIEQGNRLLLWQNVPNFMTDNCQDQHETVNGKRMAISGPAIILGTSKTCAGDALIYERCRHYQGSRAQIRADEVSCVWILTLLGHRAARIGCFLRPETIDR